MARKKKKRAGEAEQAAEPKPQPPPAIATQLGELFKQAGVKAAPPKAAKPPKPRPPVTMPPPAEPLSRVTIGSPAVAPVALDRETKLSAKELRELNDAYAGVRKLSGKAAKSMPYRELAPVTQHAERQSQARQDELQARARLGALVGGGVRFKQRRDGAFVEALRDGASPKLLARVISKGFTPEATLDLHGKRAADIALLVTDFVRKRHRQGARHLLIITGKGLHSEGGVGVLGDAAIEALVSGGGAPLVAAFASAHVDHGGSGAIAVVLDAR